jgi:hypothetical protein
MSLPPDLPAGVETAVRTAARQAFDAGKRLGVKATAADLVAAQSYAVNHVAYAWIVAAANASAEAGGQAAP